MEDKSQSDTSQRALRWNACEIAYLLDGYELYSHILAFPPSPKKDKDFCWAIIAGGITSLALREVRSAQQCRAKWYAMSHQVKEKAKLKSQSNIAEEQRLACNYNEWEQRVANILGLN